MAPRLPERAPDSTVEPPGPTGAGLAVHVRVVDAGELEALRPRLVEILIDCVENGASVGFLSPLSAAEAEDYWTRVARAVGGGRRVVVVAEGAGGLVVGTAQLDVNTMPNQPHRATVSKVLVPSAMRRRGVGEALMRALEAVALQHGRWLLTLDTATAAADRLYLRLGWSPSGVIPDYALNPDGSLTHTTWYWKRLLADPPSR